MKKTLKVNLALYGLSEQGLDSLVNNCCGNILEPTADDTFYRIEFKDMNIEDEIGTLLTGTENAKMFEYCLTCFRLKGGDPSI